jgi:hypothetical protein
MGLTPHLAGTQIGLSLDRNGGGSVMAKKPQTDWEKAARALCRQASHPEDIRCFGKPMWMTYLPEAKAVLVAIGRFNEDDKPET